MYQLLVCVYWRGTTYWLIILISFTVSKWGKYLFFIIVGGGCIFHSLIGLDWIILKVLQKLCCGVCFLMLLTESGDHRLNWRSADWHFWGMMLSALGYFHDKKWEDRIFPLAFVEGFFNSMQLLKCFKLLKCHFRPNWKSSLNSAV